MAPAAEYPDSTRPPAPARSKLWLTVAVISAIPCLLVGLFLTYLAHMALNDLYPSGHKPIELVWSHAARILSLLAAAASVCTLVSIASSSSKLLTWSSRLLAPSIIGMIALGVLGVAWSNEAENRGGDWVGLDIIVALVVGVAFPGIIAFLSGLQLLAVTRMHRRK